MNNSDKALWEKLNRQGLVPSEHPADNNIQTAWFIHLMQGFSGWLAALFMLGFVGGLFGWLFNYDNEILLLIAGFACNLTAYTFYRHSDDSAFLNQLALAISLCGQFMFGWGIFELSASDESYAFIGLAAYQAILTFAMPSFLHRVMSSWFAMVALFWGLNSEGIFGLDAAVGAFLFTVIWCKEQTWFKWHSVLIPVGYGVAISLLQFSGHSLLQTELSFSYSQSEPNVWHIYSPIAGVVLQVIACIFLLCFIAKEQKLTASPKIVAGFVFIIAALILTTLAILELPAALLILLIGFHRQNRVLITLGVAALISFISWYYYSLQVTLMVKSIYLATLGVSCGVTYLVAKRLYIFNSDSLVAATSPMNRTKALALTAVLILLGAVNWNIYQKEQLLENGQTVLLELAPLDPRSIMQGDYMRLRFKLVNDAFNQPIDELPQDGFILADLDKNNRASFIEVLPSKEAASYQNDQQVILRYRIRNGQVKFATNAFFFEEGSAAIFEEAKYGEFKVAANGEMLLHSLRDSELNLLGVNTP